jgi:hypothetical protein
MSLRSDSPGRQIVWTDRPAVSADTRGPILIDLKQPRNHKLDFPEY